MKKAKILIVEDNIVNREILREFLEDMYHIIEAEDGKAALDIMCSEKNEISAVLLDLVMPKMDGFTFLKEVKKIKGLSSIPIIVMTQSDDGKSEMTSLELGAADFIPKPYNYFSIRQRLANILQLRDTAALRNTAEKDFLTGLLNKSTFYLKAAELINSSSENDYDIVCVNIEQFKLINDLFGETEGDALLISLASAMNEAAESFGGVAGRLHSDYFAICIVRQNDYSQKLVEKNASIINNRTCGINCRIVLRYGVYEIDDKTLTINVMCDRANLAIKNIKGKFNKYLGFYDESLRNQILEEQRITNEMNNALLSGQFVAYYQPKFDLATEKTIGAEALVRWVHPERGIIPPDKFIPLFEKNGFITSLDYYMWEEACKQIRRWIDLGHNPIPISVNISRVDIYNTLLCEMLDGLVKKYDIAPELLELEITESAYTENAEQMIATVSKLKELGFVVGMDDFGSGYSSLNMLNELPIDVLKLDMRFIQNAGLDKKSTVNIINFVVGLSKWMRIPVIAEGIKTKEQSTFLRAIGCRRGQGYYYAKPMPQDSFEALLLKTQSEVMPHSSDTLFSFIEPAEVWDPNSRFNTLFRGFVGALAVYELEGSSLSFLTANDRYYKEMDMNFEDIYSLPSNVFESVDEYCRSEFVELVKKASDSCGSFETECTVNFAPFSNVRRIYREFKVIHKDREKTLFLSLIRNLSGEHR